MSKVEFVVRNGVRQTKELWTIVYQYNIRLGTNLVETAGPKDARAYTVICKNTALFTSDMAVATRSARSRSSVARASSLGVVDVLQVAVERVHDDVRAVRAVGAGSDPDLGHGPRRGATGLAVRGERALLARRRLRGRVLSAGQPRRARRRPRARQRQVAAQARHHQAQQREPHPPAGAIPTSLALSVLNTASTILIFKEVRHTHRQPHSRDK